MDIVAKTELPENDKSIFIIYLYPMSKEKVTVLSVSK